MGRMATMATAYLMVCAVHGCRLVQLGADARRLIRIHGGTKSITAAISTLDTHYTRLQKNIKEKEKFEPYVEYASYHERLRT